MAAAVILVVIIVGIAAGVATRILRSGDDLAYARAEAGIFPATTAAYLSVDLHASGEQRADLHGVITAFTAQQGFAAAWEDMAGGLAGGCVKPLTQILPWAGASAAIALTEPAAPRTTPGTTRSLPDGVLIAISHTASNIPAIVGRYGLGSVSATVMYEHHAIVSIHAPASCHLAAPFYGTDLGGSVVLANSVRAIRAEIDLVEHKGASLRANPSFKALLSKADAASAGFLYLDTAAVLRNLPDDTIPAGLPGGLGFNTGMLRRLAGTVGPLGLSLAVRPDGLAMRAVLDSAGSSLGAGTNPAGNAASVLPAGSLVYLSLDDLQGIFGGVLNDLKGSPLAMPLEAFGALAGNAHGLLDGRFALSLVPDGSGKMSLTALWDVSKRADLDNSVQSAFGAANTLLGLAPKGASAGVTLYRAPGGYGYAVIHDWLVVSTDIEPVTAALENVLAGRQPALATSKAFMEATGTSDSSDGTEFYLNFQGLRPLLEHLLLPALSSSGQSEYHVRVPLLRALQSLAIRGSSRQGSTLRLDLFARVQR